MNYQKPLEATKASDIQEFKEDIMLPKTWDLATPRQRYYIRKTEIKYDVVCACLNKSAIVRWIAKYKELDAKSNLEEPPVVFNRWNRDYPTSPTEGVVTHGSTKPINPTF